MEAIREIKTVRRRQVTLNLPDRFNNLEIEIIILPLKAKQLKTNGHTEALVTAESSLKKDWNLPQEDKAWKDL